MRLIKNLCVLQRILTHSTSSSTITSQHATPLLSLQNFSTNNSPPPTPSQIPTYHGQSSFSFQVLHKSTKSNARVGKINTPHGSIDTPGFVAVATNAALKAVDFNYIDDIFASNKNGACRNDDADSSSSVAPLQLVFCNTYHLMLHPGAEIIGNAGGLHAFTGRRRDRPFITDSGGFQVFSLAYGTVHDEVHHSLKRSIQSNNNNNNNSSKRQGNLVVRIDEQGVVFKSYRDGSRLLLTPETSIDAQKMLKADIILPLDELPPYHIDADVLERSVDRTHRWEARSLIRHIENPGEQSIYGIVHGGSLPHLRQKSAQYIGSLPFDGFALGGALGANRNELMNIVHTTMKYVPFQEKPIHVLGIADPISIPGLITAGCDTFDSAHATRVGRHGAMLTENGFLRVAAGGNRSAHYTPIENCQCPTCQNHTLSYLHHLVKAKEPLAATLLSVHNIYFMCQFMMKLRQKIYNNEI